MNLPKVLIIGQPFNNDTGGGITLTNLFNGWDRDKLAVACSGYLLLDNIDTDVCNAYYQLGYEEHRWRFPFNLLQRRYTSGLLKFDKIKIQNLTIEKSKIRVKIIMDLFYPLLDYLGLTNYIKRTRLSIPFCTWMKDFNPDIIYAQASSRDNILLCLAIKHFLAKPLVFHMMDDWPSTTSENGLFKKYWHKKIDQEFRELLKESSLLLSISDEMTREYKSRYGKDFITFHNPINMDFWKKYQRKTYDLKMIPTILYAGRIGLGIETSLEMIAKAVDIVCEELKIQIKLVLQTKEKPLWINNYRCVEHNEFSSYNELPKIFAESDFLLLPYDFTQKSIKYIRFSMPTKAPEYMISGTPIIILAPQVTAIVKYANEHNIAKVITDSSISKIAEGIKQLIQNKDYRQRIAQNAKDVAERNHDSNLVTNFFRQVMLSTIEKH